MAEIRFWLNDTLVEVGDVPPTTTLLNYLRDSALLTGTKKGCAEGDCGACTVAVLDEAALDGPSWRSVNSCLVLLPMIHGRRLVTVEGLQSHEGISPGSGGHDPGSGLSVRLLYSWFCHGHV